MIVWTADGMLAVDADDIFSDRRTRELERKQTEQAEREAKVEEERARRERAPVPVGSGRVYRG